MASTSVCVCEGSLGLYVCVCVPFNHPRLPPCAHLPLPALRLRPSLNSLWENGKQSEANCHAAAARHTQVEGEVPRALTGRLLTVNEQQLAD